MFELDKELEALQSLKKHRRDKPIRAFVGDTFGAGSALASSIKIVAELAETELQTMLFESKIDQITRIQSLLVTTKPVTKQRRKATIK
jgi:hypothetical protein